MANKTHVMFCGIKSPFVLKTTINYSLFINHFWLFRFLSFFDVPTFESEPCIPCLIRFEYKRIGPVRGSKIPQSITVTNAHVQCDNHALLTRVVINVGIYSAVPAMEER